MQEFRNGPGHTGETEFLNLASTSRGIHMAKMHSRKRGRSGSKKPLHKTKPSWLRMKEKELELLIVKLAKEGKSSSVIGLELRDSYGIPDVKTVTGKRIQEILKEKGHEQLAIESALANLVAY